MAAEEQHPVRPTRARLAALHGEMCRGLVERDEPALLLLLAALAGEHVLLLGPPGTAKSELARGLRRCVTGGGYFERLLTKFSVPEEIFGPLSIKRLENDEYHRLTDGYLPTATVAFLDEIFNANSAILNALLTLLNEREFDNGTERVRTPLATVVAASNQGPDGPELGALHDRFLFRYRVEPISDDAFGALLGLPERPTSTNDAPAALSSDEIAALREAAEDVALGAAATAFLRDLRKALALKEIYVSDRRWRKIARVLRVAAAADERVEVTLFDCLLCAHCVWESAEQRPKVEEALRETLDALVSAEPKRHEVLAAAIAAQTEADAARREQACDADGNRLWIDEAGRVVTEAYLSTPATTSKGEPLFHVPEELRSKTGSSRMTATELWERCFQDRPGGVTRFEAWIDDPHNQATVKTERQPCLRAAKLDRAHITARARQADELLTDVLAFARAVAALLRNDQPTLWHWNVTGVPVTERLRDARDSLEGTKQRLHAILERIFALPERTP